MRAWGTAPGDQDRNGPGSSPFPSPRTCSGVQRATNGKGAAPASRSLPEQGRHNGNGDRRPRLTSLAGRVGRLLPLLAVAALAPCAGGSNPANATPLRMGRPYTLRATPSTPPADHRSDIHGSATWYAKESVTIPAHDTTFPP